MRRFVFFVLCTCLSSSVINAEDVESDKVVECAVKAMHEYCYDVNTDAYSLTPVKDGDVVCMYAINFKSGGWILMASDDAMAPVLGYSSTGTFSMVDMPVNVSGWLETHKYFVKQLKLNEKAGDCGTRHSDWDKLESVSDDAPLVTRATTVSPLIQVNWNQTGSYNVYCPSDKDGRAVVGCVAVGMAQSMSVCQYPERPVGLASYTSSRYGTIYVNYDNEKAYNWSDIISGANSKDEVARLLYHCGVSVKMDYSPSGSGAQTASVASALKTYFSYPQSVKYLSRDSYTDTEWNALLENEIGNGRAVTYSGADLKKSYGHCFNLDGTDGKGFYHVNWGWGGQNNGYFSINSLRDATMDMDYTDQQGMVIGIRRPSENPSDIYLSNSSVAEAMPAGTVVGSIVVESEAKDPTYSYQLQGPYSPITHKYTTVPFEVKDGYLVTTKELNRESKSSYNFTLTATNTKTNTSCSKQFTVIVVSASDGINDVRLCTNVAGVYDLQGRKIADSIDDLRGTMNGVVIVRTSKGARKVIL